MAVCRQAGAPLLVVPNASPYERGKDDVRLELCQRRAREAGAALAYCNLVGGQDELVFDGDSILVSASGELLARGPQFEEALIVADLELPAAAGVSAETSGEAADAGDGTVITIERVTLPDIPDMPDVRLGRAGPGWWWSGAGRIGAGGSGSRGVVESDEEAGPFWPRLDDLAEVYAALVLGTADYVRKNGFRSVILALSGGIDSALTATIAADAIGPENVHVVLMPRRWSSDHSVTDAEDLVKRQGVHARTIAIQDIVDAFRAGLGEGFPATGLPAENLQSRVRGVINMALSNAEGHLVLTTGNKSEIATGYSTLYGDSAGGFGPIKDVLKTLVWELSRWRNEQAERTGATPPIPSNSITKPPSAELAPGQLDTDSLPEYEVLDALLDDYVEKDMGSADADRGRPRPGARRAGDQAGRPGRVQAPPVPAGPEDQPQELRPRPPAADHRPLAGVASRLVVGLAGAGRRGGLVVLGWLVGWPGQEAMASVRTASRVASPGLVLADGFVCRKARDRHRGRLGNGAGAGPSARRRRMLRRRLRSQRRPAGGDGRAGVERGGGKRPGHRPCVRRVDRGGGAAVPR